MLQRMLAQPRLEMENAASYMTRVMKKRNHVRDRNFIEYWSCTYHRSVYTSWAGHLARLRLYAPDRLTLKVLHFKDWDWICALADQCGGRQHHGRILRTWRWERTMYKLLKKESWEAAALNRDDWNENLESFVEWRSKIR